MTKMLPAMQRYVDAVVAGRQQARRGHPNGPRYMIVETGSFHKTTRVDRLGRTEELVPLMHAVLNPRRQGNVKS